MTTFSRAPNFRVSNNRHVADSIDFMVDQVESMDRSSIASRLVIGSTRNYVEPQRLRHLNITLIEGFDNPGVSEKLQVCFLKVYFVKYIRY